MKCNARYAGGLGTGNEGAAMLTRADKAQAVLDALSGCKECSDYRAYRQQNYGCLCEELDYLMQQESQRQADEDYAREYYYGYSSNYDHL